MGLIYIKAAALLSQEEAGPIFFLPSGDLSLSHSQVWLLLASLPHFDFVLGLGNLRPYWHQAWVT